MGDDRRRRERGDSRIGTGGASRRATRLTANRAGTRGHGRSHSGEHRLAAAAITMAAAARGQQQPDERHNGKQMAQTHESFSIDAEAPGGSPGATIRENGSFRSRFGREGCRRDLNNPPTELCRTLSRRQQAQADSSALFHSGRDTCSDLAAPAVSSLDSERRQCCNRKHWEVAWC
jgi:hypothetical protein